MRRLALVIVMAWVAVGTAAASAAPGAPEPQCMDLNFVDPTGDQYLAPHLPSAEGRAELLRGFLTVHGDAVYVNLVLAQVASDVPQGYNHLQYTVEYSVGAAATQASHPWVGGVVTDDGVSFQSTAANGQRASLEGRLYEGAEGVVTMRLPEARPADTVMLHAAGVTLFAGGSVDTGAAGEWGGWSGAHSDVAEGTQQSTACAVPAAAPQLSAPAAALPVAAPVAQAPVRLAVRTLGLSARRINRARRMAIEVSAPAGVQGLKGRLEFRGRKVAAGRGLRDGRLALRVLRKVGAGRHTLVLTFRTSSGEQLTQRVAVRLSR